MAGNSHLLISPQFGLNADGTVVAGGLQVFSRMLARALASAPSLAQLSVWGLLDTPADAELLAKSIAAYAHAGLQLRVRGFAGGRGQMALALLGEGRQYTEISYALVNQARLALLPGHRPYTVWEIGEELFAPLAWPERYALKHAKRLLSISQNTNDQAQQHTPGLPAAQVVYLCVEPPLFAPEPALDPATNIAYNPSQRQPAVMIVGSMYRALNYKGHRELIAGWPQPNYGLLAVVILLMNLRRKRRLYQGGRARKCCSWAALAILTCKRAMPSAGFLPCPAAAKALALCLQRPCVTVCPVSAANTIVCAKWCKITSLVCW
jgi:hypothetical protein